MKKEVKQKAGQLSPAPALIVSCRDKSGRNNAIVVGFAANVSLNPAMVMVGIQTHHFSYGIIKEQGEFIINFAAKGNEDLYMYMGTKSGKNEDKFAAMNVAWENGKVVDAPILTDCPVSMECKIVSSVKPGTHELFFATVEAIHCDKEYLDENGRIQWYKIPLLQNAELFK